MGLLLVVATTTPAGISGNLSLRDCRAHEDLIVIDAAVRSYCEIHGQLPDSLARWKLPMFGDWRDLEAGPYDPWDHPYELLLTSDGQWQVLSLGPDGCRDTEDDIAVSAPTAPLIR